MTQPRIDFMADHHELIEPVIEMQWSEWGAGLSHAERERWTELLRTDTNRHGVPTAFVAVAEDGAALGVVSLHEFDIESRRDRSPWICGMLVRRDVRNGGIGRALLSRVENFAKQAQIDRLWVFTEHAAKFYVQYGWAEVEKLNDDRLGSGVVLTKRTDGHTTSRP